MLKNVQEYNRGALLPKLYTYSKQEPLYEQEATGSPYSGRSN